MNSIMFGFFRNSILFMIRIYQRFLIGILGSQCRFYPSCSHYAYYCFEYLPLYKAFALILYRIFRCHPYAKGGFDYPPGYENIQKNEKVNYSIDHAKRKS